MISLLLDDQIIEIPIRNKSPIETISLRTRVHRAMDGTVYSHVNPSDKTKLSYTLDQISNAKMRQLITLFKTIKDTIFILEDADTGKNWRGKLISFPIQAAENGICDATITLVFLGTQI